MVNPSREFRTYQTLERSLPLDGIIATRDNVMEQLVIVYERCVTHTCLDWNRMPDLNVVDQAYAAIAQHVAGLASVDYTAEDIEDFCFNIEQMQEQAERRTRSQTQKQLEEESRGLWALSGMYLSALCNCVRDDDIVLRFTWLSAPSRRLQIIRGKMFTRRGTLWRFARRRLRRWRNVYTGQCS